MAYSSCKDCEDIQRGGKAPRCLVCIYHDTSIFNKPKVIECEIITSEHIVSDRDTVYKTLALYEKGVTIDNVKISVISNNSNNSKFADIYAANADSWEANGIDCQEYFGFIKQDVDAENERISKRHYWYFTFPCDSSLRNKYVRVFGTNVESREVVEKSYPDKDYKQWSIKEWNTPNKYTRRKPCDCYIKWTI